jgi:general secretion pathway protein J
MTTRSCRLPPDAGVALVEALASLVIVGMIALMLATGAATGRRVWERLDNREATGEAIDSAQTTLRDRLEESFPATVYDQTPPRPDFEGAATSIEFLSNPPQAVRPAPLRRYTLSLAASGALTLSSISDVGPRDKAIAAREILLRGVRSLEFSYFGPQPPDGGRRWGSVWHAQPALPEAVRVRVAFAPDDHRQWPDLIVRPLATVDSACLLNPVTHRCKGRI